MGLVGKWTKLSTAQCDQVYPAEIEFFERPRYLGRKGPGQSFIWWDAGSYEVVSKDEIRISVATDEQTLYRFAISGDILTLIDDKGCEFQYRRST